VGAKPKTTAAEAATETFLTPASPARPPARLASPEDAATESPALRLQATLADNLADPAVGRWSARRTTAFILVTCGGFWLAGAFIVRLAMRDIG
jgi:hypothetical protein